MDEPGDKKTAERLARDWSNDATITTRVKSKIAADSTLNPFNVQVTTEMGIVYLNGRVATAADKERAGEVARSVSGVKSVDNKLEVGDQ